MNMRATIIGRTMVLQAVLERASGFPSQSVSIFEAILSSTFLYSILHTSKARRFAIPYPEIVHYWSLQGLPEPILPPRVASDITQDSALNQLVHNPSRGKKNLDLLLMSDPKRVHSVEVVVGLPKANHDAVDFEHWSGLYACIELFSQKHNNIIDVCV